MYLPISCVKSEKDIIPDPDTVEIGSEVLLPGGEYEMGDHFGFVDPSHPSDDGDDVESLNPLVQHRLCSRSLRARPADL